MTVEMISTAATADAKRERRTKPKRTITRWTDATCRTVNDTDEVMVLTVGGGLYMEVPPRARASDPRVWRHAYRVHRLKDGEVKLVKTRDTLKGGYPANSLKQAVAWRDANKAILARGEDPRGVRRADEAAKLRAPARTCPSAPSPGNTST